MMDLDEAIRHCEEVAKENYNVGFLCHANPNDEELNKCVECAREHEQLAEWLRELKAYRELLNIAYGGLSDPTIDNAVVYAKFYRNCWKVKESKE